MDLRIEVAGSHARLAAIAPAWEALAANACEPNPFYEPWYLLSALRARRGDRARYAEVGRAPGDDFSAEIERFLALEASGWKGRAGGALACSAASLRFGREVLGEAARRGRLHMVGIDCDGQPIARRYSILAGEGAYAYKTAYDEAYACY